MIKSRQRMPFARSMKLRRSVVGVCWGLGLAGCSQAPLESDHDHSHDGPCECLSEGASSDAPSSNAAETESHRAGTSPAATPKTHDDSATQDSDWTSACSEPLFPAEDRYFSELTRCTAATSNIAAYGDGVQRLGVETLAPQTLRISGPGYLSFAAEAQDTQWLSDHYRKTAAISVEPDGHLVDELGRKLLVASAEDSDCLFAARLPRELLPRATSRIEIIANLDSNEFVPTVGWDTQNPSGTSNFSSSVAVVDEQGAVHMLDIYFRKSGANALEYHVLASGDEVVPRAPGLNWEVGFGELSFTTGGALDIVTVSAPVAVTFTSGDELLVDLDFGSTAANGGTGLDGVTQFNSPSDVAALSQDGFEWHIVSGYSLSVDGALRATTRHTRYEWDYERGGLFAAEVEGPEHLVGYVVLARFADESELSGEANSCVPTLRSGAPEMGLPLTDERGACILEE